MYLSLTRETLRMAYHVARFKPATEMALAAGVLIGAFALVTHLWGPIETARSFFLPYAIAVLVVLGLTYYLQSE